jgi:hypothetical protein
MASADELVAQALKTADDLAAVEDAAKAAEEKDADPDNSQDPELLAEGAYARPGATGAVGALAPSALSGS